jgi:F420-dependent oxidoreductase-like protein
MRVGISIASFTYPGGDAAIGPVVADIARTADSAGFDSLWVMDHFFQIPTNGPAEEPMLEGWTTLGYLAGITRRATLGLLVGGIHYRQPGLWLKAATTLDVLSGGRAYLGLGAAWNDFESRSLGFPMPPLSERFERLEDTLRFAREMWQGERGSEQAFRGRHLLAERALNRPQALRRPHPPILVGGGGERRTLRLVAEFADACNVFGNPQAVAHKYEVLREHCDAVGREYESIERTAVVMAARGIEPGRGAEAADMESPELVDTLAAYADAGCQHAILGLPRVHDLEVIERIGREVVPQVHPLGTKVRESRAA